MHNNYQYIQFQLFLLLFNNVVISPTMCIWRKKKDLAKKEHRTRAHYFA